MPYERMARNLNQSVFAFILAVGFSALLLAIFTSRALILAIFEVPLAFLVALITITECIYSYRDEVSLDATIKMLRPLLKSLLISIPVILLYSAIIIILEQTVPMFRNALEPLFNEIIQSINQPFIAIPIIFFIPIFIMIVSSPFLFYFYGKAHLILFGSPKERRKEDKEKKIELEEKEYEKKIFTATDELDQQAVRLQQYFLELQGIGSLIEAVNDHESYKTLSIRLTMMNDYVVGMGLDQEDKEIKQIKEDEEIKQKLRELEIQKSTILDIIKQNQKKLKNEKGKFEKEEEDYYEEEEISEESEQIKEEQKEEIKVEETPLQEETSIEEEKSEEKENNKES